MKFKQDALAKGIYDFIKFFIGLLIGYVLLNIIPISNFFGEFLQTKHELSLLELLLYFSLFAWIVVLISRVFTNRRLNLMIKDLHTDELTGLSNHKALKEGLLEAIESSKKENKSLSLILMDIDNFKNFNTEYGQITADEILKKFGSLLKSDNRVTDKIYRQHNKGDEFIILAKETILENAIKAANRKRELIAHTGIQIDHASSPFYLTVCCGVVELNSFDSDNALLERAHAALLRAKATSGKNKTESLI